MEVFAHVLIIGYLTALFGLAILLCFEDGCYEEESYMEGG